MYGDDFSLYSIIKNRFANNWHLRNHDIIKTHRAQISFNWFYTTPEGSTGIISDQELKLQQRAPFLTSATEALILESQIGSRW